MSRRLEQIPICFLQSVGDRLGHRVLWLLQNGDKICNERVRWRGRDREREAEKERDVRMS